MDDDIYILTDDFNLKLAKQIPVGGNVSPQNLSTYLGLGQSTGNAAMVMSFVTMNPEGAYSDLLFKYVTKEGRDRESAENLRRIFVEKDMKGPATLIEKEFQKRKIEIASRADAVVGQIELPSPPRTLPGSEGACAHPESEPMES